VHKTDVFPIRREGYWIIKKLISPHVDQTHET